ncbi:MAG: threonylcarbamoyl-AMP synthase [Gammaproteobacteria bacterium]|nr:threonylcarbamoyl-AMP synthase [Gammaproteobacteria bacterium]
MAQFFQIHPENPQTRLIRQAVEIIHKGGVVIYPTDSTYALGCHIGDKGAMERIRKIRRLDDNHNFTLVCRDLSEIATYARVGNQHYRLLKALTPGAYTFIHRATKQVPRRLQHPRRKTIGIRVPDNVITQHLLAELREPLMSTTLILPGDELPMTDPYEMREILGHAVELVIDGGYCGFEETTVIDMEEETPSILRVGKGDPALFEQV